MKKISHIRVVNYRGIELREADIAPSGAMISGRNEGGKTSLVKAIRSALAGNDIGPDAIRLGSDRAEILINLDDVTVKRVITPKTSTVTVTNADGFRAPKPQAFLTELLGTSPLDPLDLFLAKPADRRKIILGALPVTVTVDQLRRWVPDISDGFDCSGHGLEVIERLRKQAYEIRTVANATAKAARATATSLADEATARAKVVPAGTPPLDIATFNLLAVTDEVKELETQSHAAAKAREKSAGARERIAALRSKAGSILAERPTPPHASDLTAAEHAHSTCLKEIARLEEAVKAAVLAARLAGETHSALRTRTNESVAALSQAAAIQAQADEIESTLRETAVDAPSSESLVAAQDKQAAAQAHLDAAKAAKIAEDARAAAGKAHDAATKTEAAASHLDDVVRALTHDAPAALIAESKGIPGLTLQGDDIVLDGVGIDHVSGAQQMKLAVEIARRANAKSKILVVDGLERLDPEQLEVFVRLATADDFQLIGTRVDRGEVVLTAIEADATAEAAE